MAIGLAVGVGLVITVAASSNGVSSAQSQVLHSLYGVGTDLTVTKAPTFGSGGPSHFGGAPGTHSRTSTFSGAHLVSTPGLATLPSSDTTKISSLGGVKSAVGGLSLTSFTFSGQFSFSSSPGGSGSSGSGGAPSFSATTFSVQGVDIANPTVGPLSGSTVVSGHYFSSNDGDSAVALVDSSYAKQQGLKVGSTVTVAGSSYKVLGIVAPPTGGTGSDVYLPLAKAQSAAGDSNDVNTIYIESDSSSDVSTVKSEVNKELPSVTVTTAQDLAKDVSSSLGAASSLSSSLGIWLAIIVLVVAFALAALLTLASVSRRVREFGVLKAMGWRSRRIVAQIVGEGVAEGIAGGALGIGIGFLGATMVGKLGGTVKATVSPTGATTTSSSTSGTTPGFGGGHGFFGGGAGHGFGGTLGHIVTLHLTAPVSGEIMGLAIGLAVAGGLLAGIAGGWRVARLRPAVALRHVE